MGVLEVKQSHWQPSAVPSRKASAAELRSMGDLSQRDHLASLAITGQTQKRTRPQRAAPVAASPLS